MICLDIHNAMDDRSIDIAKFCCMKNIMEKRGEIWESSILYLYAYSRDSSVDRETFDEGDLAWRIMVPSKLDPPRLSGPRGLLHTTQPAAALSPKHHRVCSLLYFITAVMIIVVRERDLSYECKLTCYSHPGVERMVGGLLM